MAVMRKHFRVVVGRQIRVSQSEVAGKIAERIPGFLLLGDDIDIKFVGRPDCPIDTHLAFRFLYFDGLVDVHYWPAIVLLHPPAIKPELHDVGVLTGDGNQFLQLLEHIFIVILALVSHIAVDLPVPQGIIKSETYAVLLTCLGNGLHHICRVARVGNIIFRVLAVPKAKAVVVLRYQDDILHAALLGGSHPLLRIDLRRIVRRCRFGPICPFLVMKSVYAKVQEHAVFAFYLLLLRRTWRVGRYRQMKFLPPHTL